MSSVDGRVIPARWTEPFGGRQMSEFARVYAEIGRSLDTDAWMFGLNTAREFMPLKFVGKDNTCSGPREPYVSARKSKRLCVLADPEAGIYYNVATLRGDDIAVVLPESATDEYLAHLRKAGVSYLFGGRDGMDMRVAMATLATTFGVKRLSLQGGGIIDGAMLQAGLLDEISIAMYPGIDGLGGAPSTFHYIGGATDRPARGQRLELSEAETYDNGIVWLRYKVHHSGRR